MKKLLTALMTISLIFAPIGDSILWDHSSTVEAKSYRSGKKSFNYNNNQFNSNKPSLFQNKKQDSVTNNKSQAKTQAGKNGTFMSMSSPLMKGLMLGGLAGLLFGGLLGNLGVLGSLLGLAINLFAILALLMIAGKIYSFFKDKKKKKETNPWSR